MFKIAILRERNTPPDSRAPLTPEQCRMLMDKYPGFSVFVEPSPDRVFPDQEYENAGCKLTSNIESCNLLLGVKEVPVNYLIAGGSYMFFSHTHKGQKHNKPLLQALCANNITLYDYELLTDNKNRRLIAFGRYAGIVGAHYALIMTGKSTGAFELPGAKEVGDLKKLFEMQKAISLPPVRIALTGKGKVAEGAKEVLLNAGIQEVAVKAFHDNAFTEAVFAQFGSEDIYEPVYGTFDKEAFYRDPSSYRSKSKPYLSVANVLINAIFWDPRSPRLFEVEDIQEDCKLINICDISCDIEGSVPVTIKNTTSEDPFLGYDPNTGSYVRPFTKNSINVMAVNNLPDELASDASRDFGEVLCSKILPEFLKGEGEVLERACLVRKGKINKAYRFLEKQLKL